MREPRPDWSPIGVNFKILDDHPHLFYIRVPPGGTLVSNDSDARGRNFPFRKRSLPFGSVSIEKKKSATENKLGLFPCKSLSLSTTPSR